MTAAQSADVLVVGGDGLIGAALTEFLRAAGLSVHSSTRRSERASPERPLVDLGASAWPSVDMSRYGSAVIAAGAVGLEACDADPVGTWQINVDGVGALVGSLARRGTRVILISTSQVFDGRQRYPRASDPVSPTNSYGRQKVEAERRVLASPGGAVLRIAKVLTVQLPVMQRWLHDLLLNRPIHPFSDRHFAPIELGQVCDVIYRMLGRKVSGIWQLSAARDITYADLGFALADRLGFGRALVQPILQPEIFRDPSTSRLTAFDVSGIRDELGVRIADPEEVVRSVLEDLIQVE